MLTITGEGKSPGSEWLFVRKEILTLQEGLTGAIHYLKLLERKVAGLETVLNNLVEVKESPEIQELKHYQVCHL